MSDRYDELAAKVWEDKDLMQGTIRAALALLENKEEKHD